MGVSEVFVVFLLNHVLRNLVAQACCVVCGKEEARSSYVGTVLCLEGGCKIFGGLSGGEEDGFFDLSNH
jgi:hypothetical protein